MGRNTVETILGAAVILIAGVFLYFASNTVEVNKVTGYEVQARFLKIGGLTKGSDVRISGIKVGSVSESILDPITYEAVLTLSLGSDVKLPLDTVASIASSGMLGDKYVQLVPGAATEFLSASATLSKTKDYQSLEDQVGEIIFLATGGD